MAPNKNTHSTIPVTTARTAKATAQAVATAPGQDAVKFDPNTGYWDVLVKPE